MAILDKASPRWSLSCLNCILII